MKQLEITLPETIDDCRPDQLAKWVLLSEGFEKLEGLTQKLDFKVQIVSIFSGVPRNQLENASIHDINRATEFLIGMLSSHEPKDPTGEVYIEGKKYTYPLNFKHVSTGQVLDLKLIEDVYTDASKVMAILYVDEGMIYSEVDPKTKTVLNPLDERTKLFKKHFPGSEFLNVFGFFLDYYMKRKDATIALAIARTGATLTKTKNQLKKELNELTGTTGQQT